MTDGNKADNDNERKQTAIKTDSNKPDGNCES